MKAYRRLGLTALAVVWSAASLPAQALQGEPPTRQFFWTLQGNGGTTPPANFLGTVDAQPLVFKTNRSEWMRLDVVGRLGIGLTAPGQRLHVGDGNILIEGGGQTALIVKRDHTFTGVSGTSVNPIFMAGRIEGAGDGDPEFRFLYDDDGPEPERTVLEFDRKGIVASVKPEVGSHFEGFISGDPAPLFRLNSFPTMQLEMGPGGETETDVVLRRTAEGSLAVLTGGVERVRVDQYLQVPARSGEPPAGDCAASGHAGRIVVRTDGPPDFYVCRGIAGWVGK
jgi:hypothetical protein